MYIYANIKHNNDSHVQFWIRNEEAFDRHRGSLNKKEKKNRKTNSVYTMLCVILLFALAASVCGDSDTLPALLEGEKDVTDDYEDSIAAKVFTGTNWLPFLKNGPRLMLLNVLRITKRANSNNLHVIAHFTHQKEECTIVVHPKSATDNERWDITCGSDHWENVELPKL